MNDRGREPEHLSDLDFELFQQTSFDGLESEYYEADAVRSDAFDTVFGALRGRGLVPFGVYAKDVRYIDQQIQSGRDDDVARFCLRTAFLINHAAYLQDVSVDDSRQAHESTELDFANEELLKHLVGTCRTFDEAEAWISAAEEMFDIHGLPSDLQARRERIVLLGIADETERREIADRNSLRAQVRSSISSAVIELRRCGPPDDIGTVVSAVNRLAETIALHGSDMGYRSPEIIETINGNKLGIHPSLLVQLAHAWADFYR
jgi:hypothetical protein